MFGTIQIVNNQYFMAIGPSQTVVLKVEPGDVLTRGLEPGDTAEVITLRRPQNGIEAEIVNPPKIRGGVERRS